MKQPLFHSVRLLLLLGMVAAGNPVRGADATDADEIVHNSNCTAYYSGSDGRARVDMTIVDKQNRERKRSMTILRKDDEAGDDRCSSQKYFVFFHRPSDVRKMVFTVVKNEGKDDDRWLYLPALDLIKRIAAGDKRTSFVGSHFFYEDISGRSPEEDAHELVETTENYYVLKSRPRNPSAVEFDHYLLWIHKSSWLPLKVEYFNDKGSKYRLYEVLKVDRVQGYPTVMEARMTDIGRGGSTTMRFSRVEYDLGLKDDTFNERSMRTPPRSLLR